MLTMNIVRLIMPHGREKRVIEIRGKVIKLKVIFKPLVFNHLMQI